MLTNNEKTYLFIPGGWHGGWTFDNFKPDLIILLFRQFCKLTYER